MSLATLNAALELAALDLRLVPLHDRSKVARIEDWPMLASSDPDVIRGWFDPWPGMNIGLAMGGGLVALDFDNRNGGRRRHRRMVVKGMLPESAWARTGGDGRHHLYRVPAGWRIANRHDFVPGVDIKGEGGYIVVEPSLYPGRRRIPREYVWERHPR
jgi:hypothetical protein